MSVEKLPAEFVKECLEYNPGTGIFRWKSRPIHHFSSLRNQNKINNSYAGRIAGSPQTKGYLVIGLRNWSYLAHRLAWLITTGEWPSDQIDHINGIKTDNRIVNLRLATPSENQSNAKRSLRNTSGVKGVCRQRKKWRASLRVNKVPRVLGHFDTREEAELCVRKAREKFHGQFLNHGDHAI